MINPNRQKPTVTLEDLLRLKRAERPPVEFWDQFDRELRAKQLAAIVEPRPWWAPLIRFGGRMTRYQLPIGAAAVLALSFVTIREYKTGGSLPVYTAPAISSLSTPAAIPVEQPKVESVSPLARETVAVMTPAAATTIAQETPAPVAPASAPAVNAMPNQASVAATFAGLGAGFASQPEDAGSTRFMNASLPIQSDSEAILGDALTRPSRTLAVRQPMREPLTQIATPREARLARLLSSGLSTSMASNADLAVRSTDRASRNLTEDRLYESIGRINASGAGVLVKF